MAHTGLLSLGSLVLRIMARPQTALVWLPCIHSEDSKANNEPTYSSQGPFYTPKFWASAAWQISVHEFQFSPLGSALFFHKNVLYSFPPNPMSKVTQQVNGRTGSRTMSVCLYMLHYIVSLSFISCLSEPQHSMESELYYHNPTSFCSSRTHCSSQTSLFLRSLLSG